MYFKRNSGKRFCMMLLLENLKKYFYQERECWMCWFPVLFGIGIGIYFVLPVEPSKWIIVCVIEVLLLVAFCLRRYPEKLFIVSGALIIAFGFADIQGQTIYKSSTLEVLQNKEVTYFKGRISKIDFSAKQKVRLMLEDASDYDKSRRGKFRITLSSRKTELKEGQCVEMIVTLMPNFLPVLSDSYQFGRKAFFEGISASGYALSKAYVTDCDTEPKLWNKLGQTLRYVRKAIVSRIEKYLPPDEAGIAAAIVAGERGGISKQITENYRNSGLAHFLSISGLHMSMVAGMAFFALRMLLTMIPQYACRYNSKKVAAVFAIFISFVYLLISGAEIPTQRAFIMTFVVLLGVLADRRAISMRMVSFAALVVLVISPNALISAGFQMSFAAVVVLIAFYERYASTINKLFSGKNIFQIIMAYMSGLVISDFVASLATLPFAIYHFNQVAVYTTLGNLLAGPIIGLLIMPFVLVALLAMPFGLEFLPLKLVGLGIYWVNAITDWVAHLPEAGFKIMAMPLWGLIFMVVGGLWLCLWQQKWRRFGIVAVLLGILSIFMVKKPDALYDASGKTIALLDNAGNVVVMPSRANVWARDMWLEKTISRPLEQSETDDLRLIYKGKTTNPDWLDLKCNYKECIYKNEFVFAKSGKIKVFGKEVNPKEDAGGAVYISSRKLKTVCGSIGSRPWNTCGKFR